MILLFLAKTDGLWGGKDLFCILLMAVMQWIKQNSNSDNRFLLFIL